MLLRLFSLVFCWATFFGALLGVNFCDLLVLTAALTGDEKDLFTWEFFWVTFFGYWGILRVERV
jgi:hypothetical protein